MLRLSLRARLLAGMGLVVIALVVVALIVTRDHRTHLIDQVDARLTAAGGPTTARRPRRRSRPPEPTSTSDVRQRRHAARHRVRPGRRIPRTAGAHARRGRAARRWSAVHGRCHGRLRLHYRVIVRPYRDDVRRHRSVAHRRRRDGGPADPARGRRDVDHLRRARRGDVVGGAPRHPPDQADDRGRHRDRRRRPLPPGARGARRPPRRVELGGALNTCSSGSTTPSTSRPRRRLACAASWPTPRTSCARR